MGTVRTRLTDSRIDAILEAVEPYTGADGRRGPGIGMMRAYP